MAVTQRMPQVISPSYALRCEFKALLHSEPCAHTYPQLLRRRQQPQSCGIHIALLFADEEDGFFDDETEKEGAAASSNTMASLRTRTCRL